MGRCIRDYKYAGSCLSKCLEEELLPINCCSLISFNTAIENDTWIIETKCFIGKWNNIDFVSVYWPFKILFIFVPLCSMKVSCDIQPSALLGEPGLCVTEPLSKISHGYAGHVWIILIWVPMTASSSILVVILYLSSRIRVYTSHNYLHSCGDWCSKGCISLLHSHT